MLRNTQMCSFKNIDTLNCDMIGNVKMYSTSNVKQQAYLYDEKYNPKILPEKYAISSAMLIDETLLYNHTPDKCVCIVERAKLPVD